MRIARVLVLALLAWLPPTLAAQAHPETVRGRVVSDSGKAVPEAVVTITRAPDRETLTTRTDSTGAFSLTFAEGTGDYLVHVNALGWTPFRRRVTRTGAEAVLPVEVKLTPKPVELAGVTVSGRRERPSRNTGLGTEAGASEQVVDGVTGALSPEQMGDLAAMAATIPGVMAGPGGVSVMGLDPGQNNATLNGMSFSGADIPRDARTWTRFSTSAYDPSRGGFSGAQTSVDLSPGNDFSFRRSHLTLDAPSLQYTDPVSQQLGGRFTGLQLSAGADGALVPGRYVYNAAVQGSHRTTPAASLLDAGADVLRLSGVSPDSAGRFLGLLATAGIPTRAAGIPSARTADNLSVIGRIDHTPNATRTWGVTAYGKLARSEAGSLAATSTPAHGGSSFSGTGMLQGVYSFYHRKNTLNETRSALTYSADRSDPYLLLPEGQVAVSSSFADGTGGISSLAFGGNGGMDSDRRSWTWETTNTTQWYDLGNRHRVKVYAQSRLDG
ncbi:MAG: carboxypeptidase regulatory-like domain-containing protein, partial [Gemmatimonadetes bacterium]|nr:carboxypeptidase regulatory-like domain-containing protein [Gemmatimonadota bacterium]